jgi:nicotinamidase-related amidase
MRGKISWQRPRSSRYTIGEWEIEGHATALLLLDLQIAHVDPARGAGPELKARFPRLAAYYYERLRDVVLPAVLELQRFFRQRDLAVMYANSGLALPTGEELAPWSWRATGLRHPSPAGPGIPMLLPPGSPERELWPALERRPDELVLFKQTLSPFNGTALDQYLRNMEIENLVIAGLLTNGAVETTARCAGDRGLTAIVVEDACAALSPRDHADGTAFASWYVVKSSQLLMEELSPLTCPEEATAGYSGARG